MLAVGAIAAAIVLVPVVPMASASGAGGAPATMPAVELVSIVPQHGPVDTVQSDVAMVEHALGRLVELGVHHGRLEVNVVRDDTLARLLVSARAAPVACSSGGWRRAVPDLSPRGVAGRSGRGGDRRRRDHRQHRALQPPRRTHLCRPPADRAARPPASAGCRSCRRGAPRARSRGLDWPTGPANPGVAKGGPTSWRTPWARCTRDARRVCAMSAWTARSSPRWRRCSTRAGQDSGG